MKKLYIYGDSFTQRDFSVYQLDKLYQSKGNREKCISLHWTTQVHNVFPEYKLVINAQGGWSNQDILVRVLKDLPYYTEEDKVVVLGTESTRLLLPSNLDHSVQQSNNTTGVSTRAHGYPLVAVPSTILAMEYEKDTNGPYVDVWKAGIDMYHNVTVPYKDDYFKYWNDALESLFIHINDITSKAIYIPSTVWPAFESWRDIDKEKYGDDGHWSVDGWKAFSQYVITLLTKTTPHGMEGIPPGQDYRI